MIRPPPHRSGCSQARPGTVYLVGAGPGDPDLLTVRAARLLGRADVVVHDALIGRGILELAPENARIVDVGKRCGGQRTSQERINEMLIEAAAEAAVVVRLKGGDPFVFGRGGEEALALAEAGIPFEVVPGVTAGVGVSAYAGIPVTHRDFASSVTFVTGHEDMTRAEARVDWEALARIEGTIVVYMGVSNLDPIAERLIAGGRDAATPTAIIEWGTVPRQRTVVGSLGTIARLAAEAEIRAPALIVVGEVVALRERLDWFRPAPSSPASASSPAPRASSPVPGASSPASPSSSPAPRASSPVPRASSPAPRTSSPAPRPSSPAPPPSSPRKRGSRAAGSDASSLDLRFRGDDGARRGEDEARLGDDGGQRSAADLLPDSGRPDREPLDRTVARS